MELLTTPIRGQPYTALGLSTCVPPAWNVLSRCPSELLLRHQGRTKMLHSLGNLLPRTSPLAITTLYIHFSSHMSVFQSIKVGPGVLYLPILSAWYRVVPQQTLV